MRSKFEYEVIGYIHTPFETNEGIPIQSCYSDMEGWIELFQEYSGGLKDLDGFSHIMLFYHFHKAGKAKLLVFPYLDKKPHGIFATRAPIRPNPIGISIVEVIGVEHSKSIVRIKGVDMLNSTPLLDIKPYVPHFDHRDASDGWFSQSKFNIQDSHIADNRF